jgi:hypothetical protein
VQGGFCPQVEGSGRKKCSRISPDDSKEENTDRRPGSIVLWSHSPLQKLPG